MSYFMTISGPVLLSEQFADLALVPARDAQSYVAGLESELLVLDGGPVFLVDDGETGTSDIAVADLVSALEDDVDVSSFAIFNLMNACVSNGLSFRIWWASGDDSAAHKSHVIEVENLTTAVQALKSGSGVYLHPQSGAANA